MTAGTACFRRVGVIVVAQRGEQHVAALARRMCEAVRSEKLWDGPHAGATLVFENERFDCRKPPNRPSRPDALTR